MRLTSQQAEAIRRVIREEAGDEAVVRIFGSRLDDGARGGDIDLMLQVPHAIDNPAWFASRVAARLIRALNGRHVDLVLAAPNVAWTPVHDAARTGIAL